MAMTTSSGGDKKAISDINVTPLVDVMLVLLIIFMVSTPLIVQDESDRLVDINVPQTRNNPQTVDLANTDKLILRVDSNLRVVLGADIITDCSASLAESDMVARYRVWEPCFEEVHQKLALNPRLQEQEALYLMADAAIPYGFVVGVMHRIRTAGVTNLGMVTTDTYQPVEPAPTP